MLPPSAAPGERAVVSREVDERRDHEDHEDHQAACNGDPHDLEDGAVLGGASPQLPGALPPPPAAAPRGCQQDMSASSPPAPGPLLREQGGPCAVPLPRLSSPAV